MDKDRKEYAIVFEEKASPAAFDYRRNAEYFYKDINLVKTRMESLKKLKGVREGSVRFLEYVPGTVTSEGNRVFIIIMKEGRRVRVEATQHAYSLF